MPPTSPNRRRRPLAAPALALGLAAAAALAACSGAANPPSPADVTPGAPAATPPAGGTVPGAGPVGGGMDPGGGVVGGGGVPGDPGSGVGSGPVNPGPVDPGTGQAKLVRPVPGRANPHPVAPIRIETSIDGRHVLVRISWYGGVEPCSVLDSVRVERNGTDIAVTPIEGSSQLGVACIDIALLKATIVDLGELEPGSYRVSSPGSEAPPALFTID